MKTKFITSDFVLDLSGVNYSVQEFNTKISEDVFAKFFFPVEIPIDDRVVSFLGDYQSYEAVIPTNQYTGYLQFEDKISKGQALAQSVENNVLGTQISYGLDEFSNWKKKLAELPLMKFAVPDIHTYATTVISKKYPETSFNFPRIYNKKYSPDQQVWDAFDGYLNDMKTDMSEMRRNYIDVNGAIFNTNIIHPCPYVLYLLKTAISDAGFELRGDILTDADLYQRTVYSGTENFRSKRQAKHTIKVNSLAPDSVETITGNWWVKKEMASHAAEVTLERPGKYKISGTVRINKEKQTWYQYNLDLNGSSFWSKGQSVNNDSYFQDVNIALEINVTSPNSVLKFSCIRHINYEQNYDIANLLITSTALEDISNSAIGNDAGLVENANDIDLSRVVPDITVGDFISTIRKWFNYDFEPRGREIWMNKLNNENPYLAKDWREFELSFGKPKREFQQDISYLIKFPEIEKPLDSMYFDKAGAKINGKENETTIITEVNGYAVPVEVPKPNGHNTAVVQTDSTSMVQLVYYDGLSAGKNNATNPSGCQFPELFSKNWEKWLLRRLNRVKYSWTFKADQERFSQFTVRDYVYCYNNIHIITSWTKNKVDANTYEVNVETEALN